MASIKRRRGSEIWTCWFRDENGRQHCRSTETVERKLAQKIADQFEAAAQKKRTMRAFSRVMAEMHELVSGAGPSSVSVAEFVNEWLQCKKAETAKGTSTFYATGTQRFIAFLGERANEPLSQITKRDLISYRNALAADLAPRTVNHHLVLVKMLFKSAKRDEHIQDDPSQFVEAVRRSHSETNRRAFTLAEISAVLNVAEPEWRSLVLFGLYTGQRLGDIAAFTWNNVDPQLGQLRFVTAKTGRTMVLPLAPALAKHVLGMAVSDNPEDPLHPRAYAILKAQGRCGSLSNQFGDLLAQAGLRETRSHHKTKDGRSARRQSSGLSFHSLRHSATSFLHAAGIPAATTQAFV
jgi:integrase